MLEIRKEAWNRVALVAFLGHLALALWFVERGRLNADEGWYLYAARMMAMGHLPHQDFQFFQPPVYPRLMAGLVDSGPGVLLAGRWWSWLMLVVSVGVMSLSARRVAGTFGGAVALLCVGFHPLVLGTAVLAKPYALTLLLVASSLFLLLGQAGRTVRTILGFFLLALAVGTRLSLLALAVPLLVGQRGRHRWIAGLGMGLGAWVVSYSLPANAMALIWQQLIGFHWGDGGSIGPRLAWLFNVVTVWGVFGLGLVGRKEPIRGLRVGSVLAILVHLFPAQLHVEHLIVVLPALVVLLVSAAESHGDALRSLFFGGGLFCLGLMIAVPFVHMDNQYSSVKQTMMLGAWLHENVPKNQPLLTLQVALAVEADRDVVSGCEMGRFGKVDREKLVESIGPGLGGVALSNGDFEPSFRDQIAQLSDAHFPLEREETTYGQFEERLQLWAGNAIWMR